MEGFCGVSDDNLLILRNELTAGRTNHLREQALIVEAVDGLRARLPFPLLGVDTDNDSAFLNDTLFNYCKEQGITLTRSRAYHKNDQAWVEQKNGSIVRKLVGFLRPRPCGGSMKAHACTPISSNPPLN